MDIYLTDLETNDTMRFPMLPAKISVQTGAIFQNYAIMTIGDKKLPAGEQLTGFSWDGMLPGEARKRTFPDGTNKYEPYITEWRDPHEIQSLWSVYRVNKKKLRLLVTETPINHDVYLERYNVEYSGGYGDYSYSISFIHAKDLKIYPSGATGESSSTANTAASRSEGQERPSPPPSGTYTVASGDSLWKIAQKLMGAGSRYTELLEANKDVIGSDPNKIYPGQILTIPS